MQRFAHAGPREGQVVSGGANVSPLQPPLKSLKGHEETKATVSMATAALRGRMPSSRRQLKTPGSPRGQPEKKMFPHIWPPVTPSQHCRTRKTFCPGCGCIFEEKKKKEGPVMTAHRKRLDRTLPHNVFSAGSFPPASHEQYNSVH